MSGKSAITNTNTGAKSGSIETCKLLCNNNPNCKGFQRKKDETHDQCWLYKASDEPLKDNSAWDIWKKNP